MADLAQSTVVSASRRKTLLKTPSDVSSASIGTGNVQSRAVPVTALSSGSSTGHDSTVAGASGGASCPATGAYMSSSPPADVVSPLLLRLPTDTRATVADSGARHAGGFSSTRGQFATAVRVAVAADSPSGGNAAVTVASPAAAVDVVGAVPFSLPAGGHSSGTRTTGRAGGATRGSPTAPTPPRHPTVGRRNTRYSRVLSSSPPSSQVPARSPSRYDSHLSVTRCLNKASTRCVISFVVVLAGVCLQ